MQNDVTGDHGVIFSRNVETDAGFLTETQLRSKRTSVSEIGEVIIGEVQQQFTTNNNCVFCVVAHHGV
jgi:hypothetical protein